MTTTVDVLSANPASVRRPAAVALPAAGSAPVRDATSVKHEKKSAAATPTQVNAALAEINQTLQMALIGVRFEFDKEADTMIAKVVDVVSGEVIRQMPAEEVVRISKVLGKLQGLLVHQTS